MVPDEFGHFPEYREVTGTPSGSVWALLGLSGKEEEAAKVGAPPLLVQFRLEGEGARGCLGRPSSSPLRPNRPITLPGGFR